MKELPIRKFTTVVGYLTETVTITVDGRPIGTYTPIWKTEVKAHMDEPIRKAIEPEQVKQTDGRLSKGLGTLPGQPAPKPVIEGQGIAGGVYPSRPFTPAPKPGKTGAKK